MWAKQDPVLSLGYDGRSPRLQWVRKDLDWWTGMKWVGLEAVWGWPGEALIK